MMKYIKCTINIKFNEFKIIVSIVIIDINDGIKFCILFEIFRI